MLMMEYYCLRPMESWDLSQVEEETLWAFFCLEVLCVLYLWHWYLNHSYVPSSLLFGLTFGVFEASSFEDTMSTLISRFSSWQHSYLHSFLALSIVGDTVEVLVKASMGLHCSAVTEHLFFKATLLQPVMWKEFTHLASKKVICSTGRGRFSR